MFSFITTKLLAYVSGALLVSLIVTGGFAGCEHHNAKAARADRDAMESERDAARSQRDGVVAANKTQQQTIDAQDKALTEWAKIGVTPADVAALLVSVTAKRAELDELLASNAKQKAKDDANPDCQKLLAVDYQRVCPNRARVLRGYENRLPRQGGARPDAGLHSPP